jgi:hypothetical protein
MHRIPASTCAGVVSYMISIWLIEFFAAKLILAPTLESLVGSVPEGVTDIVRTFTVNPLSPYGGRGDWMVFSFQMLFQ